MQSNENIYPAEAPIEKQISEEPGANSSEQAIPLDEQVRETSRKDAMDEGNINGLTETVTQGKARTDATNASGPRTAKGKQRSSRNALKRGIFSKSLILESESRAEYQSLLKGVQENLQPQGTVESALVESLAVILWRKRRLVPAESAEISKARFFAAHNAYETQRVEVWDRYRAGETAGGMLRPSPNPFLIQEGIDILTKLRDHIEKFGFDQNISSFLLKKLYGVDHDGEPPAGIYREFAFLFLRSAQAQNQNEPGVVDILKNGMVEYFNLELKWLESQQLVRTTLHERKGQYEALAALIPQPDAMDRLVRYETHLSREFDRLLNQLERVQRMRRGQSPPPTLNIDVS
ncbi:MAG: hypothetical protein WCA38_03305 [Candidatus Acidiferrales bacterium]